MALSVFIVGAGPTGLTLANVLAAYGVDFRIVDRKSGPVRESRANFMGVRTLELLERLGVVDKLLAAGDKVTHVEFYTRGRLAAEFPFAGIDLQTPYPYSLGVPQRTIEQVLADAIAEQDRAVEWDTELVSLHGGDHGAVVVVRGSDGAEETISAQWVVAGDGASSRVRGALGLDFAGKTYDPIGLLADVDLDISPEAGIDPGRVRVILTRDGVLVIETLGRSQFRLAGGAPPAIAKKLAEAMAKQAEITHDHNPYATVNLDDIQGWFDQFPVDGARLKDVKWTGVYRMHSRLAERFQVKNVFLIGDAAHIHSPARGQGMNLGIGDAVNLGWKLALVALGQADERLLDSYAAERRPVARKSIRRTDKSFNLESGDGQFIKWLRTHVLGRVVGPLTRFKAVRRQQYEMFSQTWIAYRGSPAVAARRRSFGRRPEPGDRIIHSNATSTPAGPPDIARHHLLLFESSSNGAGIAQLAEIEELLRRYAIEVVTQRVVLDSSEQYRHYRHGDVCLVRPDGHIAYIGAAADLHGLSQYLDGLYTLRGDSRR